MTSEDENQEDSCWCSHRRRSKDKTASNQKGRWVRNQGEASASGACAAEAVGTALLVMLSCAVGGMPLIHRAFAGGLAITTLVQDIFLCFDGVSGAFFNPAMCLAAAILGRIGWARAIILSVAQMMGAICGATAAPLFNSDFDVCLTNPDTKLASEKAACIEGVCTFILAIANCASWDQNPPRGTDSWPLRIGIVVATLGLHAGALTGCSMNPARSLAPALLAKKFNHQWIYCVGPLLGAACGALLYTRVWRQVKSTTPPVFVTSPQSSTQNKLDAEP